MAGHLGALKDGDEDMLPGSANARLLDRLSVRHESIAVRMAVEAFLGRQLWSWRHAVQSNTLEKM